MKEAEEAKGLMGQKTISEILRMVASLVEEFDLAYFFQSCRNIELDLVQSLPRSLMKVARYYKLTNELIDAARDRRYSIFKTIRVATLNAREFRTSVVRLQDCSFDEVLLRYDPNNANPVVVTKGRQKSPTLTSGKNPCKVHAEIQLLHFYEFQQVPSIPRLLSASKSACYLCYLFINAHKKFQVPRTHGRLYHGWTLPDFPECVDRTPFLEAAHRFNVSLEGQIRRTLGMKYRKFNHPAESVIVLHPTWSPCATLMISKAGTPQGSETSTIRQASPAPPEVRLQPSRSASLTRNQIPLDLVSDREIPTVAVSESPQSDEDQPVTINCGRLSSSSEVQSIMIANTTWQCLRLPSSLSNVWCRHKGLDLFLEWTEGENPADTERWMGLKYTNQLENAEIADTGNSFNLTDLRLGAVRTSQGMVGIDRTLTLIWSDTGLVVKFGHGTPPEDLDNEDQIPVHLL